MADFLDRPISAAQEQKHGSTLPTSTMGSSTDFEETEPSNLPESSSPPQTEQVMLVPAPSSASSVPKDVADPPNPVEEEVPVDLKRCPSATYNAEMTPFQQKVANATCCCSSSVIGAVVATIVVLAVTNQAQRTRREALMECGRGPCAHEMQYLDAVADANVDPCADFYAYMCNRWSGSRAGAGFLQDAFDRYFVTLAAAVLRARPTSFGGEAQDADVDEVLFSGYRQTGGIFRHLDGTPAQTTSWYLALIFLAQALRIDYARRYQSGRTRDQEYLCLDLVNRALELRWHNFVSNLSFAGLAGDPELDDMFALLRENVVPAWFGNATALMAEAKLSTVDYKAYVPSGNGTFTGTQGGYNMTYLAQEADAALSRFFPGSYVALRIVTQRETMFVRPPDAAEAEMARHWAQPWPLYSESHGTVILPSPYLERPLMYLRSATPEVNYATVGVMMAKALADAIGPNSRWNMTAASADSWWRSEASFSYSMLAGCLRQHSDPNVMTRPMDPQPKRTRAFKSSLFSWMRAARAGLDALRERFRGSNPNSDRWRRAQRVFFKRFCLLSCGSERWDAMSPLERCTWPLLSFPEFRDVFKCRNDTFERFDRACNSL
ncbi:hypothetical protein HPB50_000424 [Hyalomma asiaticum]|uniref:Uncharacterized protein n=1 Tax=Hyalomma asiaticum TaxID=266040 RepID=A0ACB7RN76_HYAAI|nr:hypothetical protein HPB50_000424 [Hyalomma asiaticum]